VRCRRRFRYRWGYQYLQPVKNKEDTAFRTHPIPPRNQTLLLRSRAPKDAPDVSNTTSHTTEIQHAHDVERRFGETEKYIHPTISDTLNKYRICDLGRLCSICVKFKTTCTCGDQESLVIPRYYPLSLRIHDNGLTRIGTLPNSGYGHRVPLLIQSLDS
jgi:hypothetical protein